MAEVCAACGEETVSNAAFCHACGAPRTAALQSAGPAPNAVVQAARAPSPARQRAADRDPSSREQAEPGKTSRERDPERVLWQGGYCWRAMVGSWALACVLTLALPLAAWLMKFSSQGWIALGLLLGALWLGLALRLAYRQLSVHYYLTSQRVMHEQGLLWRQIDRIEAIDIDDVSYRQGPVERMLGVGTVQIRSSDVSTPAFSLVGIDEVDKVASMIDEARRQERLRRGLYLETT